MHWVIQRHALGGEFVFQLTKLRFVQRRKLRFLVLGNVHAPGFQRFVQFIQPGHIIVRLVHGAADLVRGQGLAPGVCRQRPGQFLGLRQFLHDSCSFPLLLQPEGKAGLILLRTRALLFSRIDWK